MKIVNDRTSFFNAARSGQLDLVEALLAQGFDVQSKNERGHSALMLAAYNGHFNLVQFLILHGADVNSVDLTGSSILMGVVFKGHMPIFELLIEANAELELKNLKQQTALDYAIMFGKRDFIFKINQLLNTQRPSGRLEQLKTWVEYIKN